MTAEEIAKQCAEAIRPVRPRQHKNMVLAQQKEVAAKLLPILTASLAAREEEYARLREAAEKSAAAFEHYQMTCREHRSPYIKENGRHGSSPYAELVESCQDLRTALTPQQEQGK